MHMHMHACVAQTAQMGQLLSIAGNAPPFPSKSSVLAESLRLSFMHQ
jgi:hypothetical protein